MANSRFGAKKMYGKPRMFVILESMEAIRDYWGHVKKTAEPT